MPHLGAVRARGDPAWRPGGQGPEAREQRAGGYLQRTNPGGWDEEDAAPQPSDPVQVGLMYHVVLLLPVSAGHVGGM